MEDKVYYKLIVVDIHFTWHYKGKSSYEWPVPGERPPNYNSASYLQSGVS